MRLHIIKYCILLLLTCNWNNYSQNILIRNNCCERYDKEFYNDGQAHQLIISNYRYTRLNVIFLPLFRYKLIICKKNSNSQIEMKLKDDKGNILYSDNNFKEWDFQFDSLLKSTIEFKLPNGKSGEEIISLVIGNRLIVTQP